MRFPRTETFFMSDINENTLIMVLLAIFLPPVAVAL